jgi:DNA polymerase-3 subunit epsilon
MKLLFFDTETAGFNGPILQLAWILTDEKGEVLEQKKTLINHTIDYEIHEGAAEIHGITKEMCISDGTSPIDELRSLLWIMSVADKVIAHNLSFDWDMVSKDRIRYSVGEPMPSHGKVFCTMKATTDICKLPHTNGRGGYKWPKLQELHVFLFGEEFDGAHDALADVKATAKCFFELVKRKVIDIGK